MNKILCFTSKSSVTKAVRILRRQFSIESFKYSKDSYKLLIIGGGAGGISTGAKFTRKIGAKNIGIVDPSKYHCM